MASITTQAGTLDVNTIVSQLVSAEKAAKLAPITRKETQSTFEISALGTLKGALSTFKSSLDGLRTQDVFTPRTASSGDDTVFTATAATTAATGTYDIEVVDLAKPHQLASAPYLAGPTATVGTGTLTITQGDKLFSVTIDSTNNTLAGIRSAINTATGNTGVQATLINESGGTRLVLSSSITGTAGAIKVAQSGGDGGLSVLQYDPAGTKNLEELQEAQQAHIRIGTYDVYNSSNSITDAIEGVTLNLKDVTEGSTVLLTVGNDSSSVVNKVKAFVNAYNTLYKTFAQLRSYNAETKEAGPMLGDALLQGVEERVRSDLVSPVADVTGSYNSLAAVGVTKQVDGTLKLDESKLNAAMTADRSGVAAMFGSTNGVASRLYKSLDSMLASGGSIDARNTRLQNTIKDVSKAKDDLNIRMAVIQERYRKQFTTLDGLLTSMQQTSNYLAQQLGSTKSS
jgi:flagellar hook-associated protein 2